MRAASFLAFAFLLAASGGRCGPQSENPGKLEARLQATVRDYELSADTFVQALTKFAAEFELPMGIEWVKTPSSMEKVKLVIERDTVSGILDSLVKTQRGYKVEIKNGVLHVLPQWSLADGRNPLNLRLNEFGVHGEYVTIASSQLRDRVRLILNPPRPLLRGQRYEGGLGSSIAIGMGDLPVSFRLQNVAVRDVLDTLCVAGGFKTWLVVYPEHRSLTRTGFLRVLSPYDLTMLPDKEQPVWSLWEWGMDPMTQRLRTDWTK